MDVEVLTGPPGCGKSYNLRQEAINNPGLYLIAYPTQELIEEQLRSFEAESDIPVVEAHSGAPGGGSVQNRLERHQAYFAANGINHAVVLMTHEGLMGADLRAFGAWDIRIDEAPTTIQSGKVSVPASASLLKQMIAIAPAGSHGWGELRLLNEVQGWRALQNDDLLRPLAEMLKQASRRHGVFVDTLEWKDSFGWCSIWPLSSVAHCRSVKIAGASYPVSIGALVAERWEGVNFVPNVKQVSRSQEPTIRIHYFTQSHEGDTAFWGKRRGRGFIVKVCDFLAAHAPDLGFWAANVEVEKLLDHRLNGPPISPKAAGLNQYDEETSCVFIYSSKPQSTDAPAKALFGITDEEIFRGREEEDILQFVMRGAIRRRDFGGDYDIYLYSKRQAELVAAKLIASQIGKSVDLVPEPGAGIMDASPDPKAAIKAAIIAQRKAERQEAYKGREALRKRNARGDKAEAEGRERSANNGRGGRPTGSKDKTPRKPRTRRS